MYFLISISPQTSSQSCSNLQKSQVVLGTYVNRLNIPPHIYVCMCVCECTYIHTHIYMYVHIYTYIYTYVYTLASKYLNQPISFRRQLCLDKAKYLHPSCLINYTPRCHSLLSAYFSCIKLPQTINHLSVLSIMYGLITSHIIIIINEQNSRKKIRTMK